MSIEVKPKKHFPGLDALRAIAAIMVIVNHIEQIKSGNRLPSLMDYAFFANAGGRNAVILFFVLSGFLITYNLLNERKNSKPISVKRFYLKRILRIWPLYYLTLILSAWAFGYTPKTSTLILCTLIFPNFAHATVGGWVPSPQTWSIGAEEQFYLGWPWILDKFRKHTLSTLVFLFVSLTLLPYLAIYLVETFYYEPVRINQIKTLVAATKFNTMVLGGIFAYIVLKWPTLLQYLKPKWASLSVTFLPFVFWFTGLYVSELNDEFYAICFGLLIVHAAFNDGGGRFLNNAVLNYLGRISYGMYMVHYVVILIGLRYVPPVFFPSLIASNIAYYIIVFGCTIGLASLSYYIIERPLLRLKAKI